MSTLDELPNRLLAKPSPYKIVNLFLIIAFLETNVNMMFVTTP
jgi:hypothetical protein